MSRRLRPPARSSVGRSSRLGWPGSYGAARRGQAVLDGVSCRLRPVRDVEFPIDVGQVELDRLLGHPQALRDLLVAGALSGDRQNLELPLRQPADELGLRPG